MIRGKRRERAETEERAEEGTEETEERSEVTEEDCKEDERCEEDSECHSAAKRARVCATFTDSKETAIVEFVKEHPELYDKEHACFHGTQKRPNTLATPNIKQITHGNTHNNKRPHRKK